MCENNGFALYNGDCLELMTNIPDGSVDLVLCDLPYGTTANKWDAIIPFDKLWESYHRVAKANAPFLLFRSEPFSTLMRNSNMKEYRYDWIWHKSNSVGFLNAGGRPMKIFEIVSVFYGQKPVYNPQGLVYNPKMQKRGGIEGNYSNPPTNEYESKYSNYPVDVLYFDYDRDRYHPTQKPVALLEYLIRTYTNDGGTVLDNTMGSGSTGVACANTGRGFIGIEKDPGYFAVAEKKIRTALESKKDVEDKKLF